MCRLWPDVRANKIHIAKKQQLNSKTTKKIKTKIKQRKREKLNIDIHLKDIQKKN